MTAEQLFASGADQYDDIYSRAGTVTALLSGGPLARNEDFLHPRFWSASADGQRAFFTTLDRLTVEDSDGGYSAYEYSGGPTAIWLAPASSVPAVSADGTRAFLFSDAPLAPTDGDSACFESGGAGCPGHLRGPRQTDRADIDRADRLRRRDERLPGLLRVQDQRVLPRVDLRRWDARAVLDQRAPRRSRHRHFVRRLPIVRRVGALARRLPERRALLPRGAQVPRGKAFRKPYGKQPMRACIAANP